MVIQYFLSLVGDDFQGLDEVVVTFNPNQVQLIVDIGIVDDVFPEDTEEFEVFLSASPGVYIELPAYARIIILNDDPDLPGNAYRLM